MQLDLLPEQTSAATAVKKSASKKAKAENDSTLPPLPKELIAALDVEGEKAPSAFRTISEAAKSLGVPQHVLRFWESRFSQIKPLKLRGGRRYYRPEDMEILTTVKHLLYKQGYTIKGAKKAFSQPAAKALQVAQPAAAAKKAPGDKRLSQLTVIRHELIGLRDVLKPYIS
jgi:DNA-binding transcriptional MerR regulator